MQKIIKSLFIIVMLFSFSYQTHANIFTDAIETTQYSLNNFFNDKKNEFTHKIDDYVDLKKNEVMKTIQNDFDKQTDKIIKTVTTDFQNQADQMKIELQDETNILKKEINSWKNI